MAKKKHEEHSEGKFVVLNGKKVPLPVPEERRFRLRKPFILFAVAIVSILAVAAWSFVGGVGMAKTITSGDSVKIDYVGSLDNGTVFDTSIESEAKKAGIYAAERGYEPLEFVVGAGQVIPGFEQGVLGMKSGESKTVKIQSDYAYGPIRTDLVLEVPAERISGSQNKTLQVGEFIFTSNGQRGVITKVSDANVTVDFNHPLAGKSLTFRVTVIEVKAK